MIAGTLFANEESLDCWCILLFGTIVGVWIGKGFVGSFDIRGWR